MLRRFLVCCLLVLANSSTVGAQAPAKAPPVPVSVDVLDDKLKELSVTLTANIDKNFRDLIKKYDDKIADLEKNLGDRVAKEDEILNKIAELEKNLGDRVAKEHEILDAISTMGDGGRPILRTDAVVESLKRKRDGRFIIENKTPTYQRIFVNRTEYGFSPGEKRALTVAGGTVTTQLPGQNLVNWMVGPPDYEESIEIVPTSRPSPTFPPPLVYRPFYYYYDYDYPRYVSY